MEQKQENNLEESLSKLTELLKDFSSRRFIFRNFTAGIIRGVGFAIGATIIFALIGWILSKLQIVPILGDWAIRILEYIENVKGY